MILTDKSILDKRRSGIIKIEPWADDQLGSNSYDLLLSKHLAVYLPYPQYRTTGNPELVCAQLQEHWADPELADQIDAAKDNPIYRFEIPDKGFILLPGMLYLGSTVEKTYCRDLVPLLEGKSSIGRLGMQVHITAGFGDVGFDGHWTLEITVVHPLKIYAGMPVAQIFWQHTDGPCSKPYNQKKSAKYTGQGPYPVPSQMFRNFEKDTFRLKHDL